MNPLSFQFNDRLSEGVLSVVIPAFNEEERLRKTLSRVLDYMDAAAVDCELIVVDDGSSDRTLEVARAHGRSIVAIRHEHNRGKGAAVRTGALAATGNRILICDADLSTPIEELPKLEAALRDGAAVAIGTRSLSGAHGRASQPLVRRILGRGFNLLVRTVLLPGVTDTQCGFKLIRRQPGRQIFEVMVTEGFAFDVELLILARRGRHSIVEVPVAWDHQDRSTISPGRDSIGMLLQLMRIRASHRRSLRHDAVDGAATSRTAASVTNR